jgi:Zn-dependent metalloprotease
MTRMGLFRSILVVAILVTGFARIVSTAHAAGGIVGNGASGSCTEAALDAALASGATVTFNCGGPATITLTSQKTIAAGQNIAIVGGGEITLSGGGTTRLFVVAAGGRLTLQNITLADGKAAGNGGALLVQGEAELTDVTVRNSQAVGSDTTGGAIFVEQGALTGANLRVLDNDAGRHGGGIANVGGTLLLRNSLVQGNEALGYAGIFSTGAAVIEFSQIAGNTATAADEFGGGIGVNGGTMAVADSTVSGNQAPGNIGGGIAVIGGDLTVERTDIADNIGGFGGGGLYVNVNSGSNVTLRDSRVLRNRTTAQDPSSYGGGIYNGGTLLLERVTVAENEAGAASGAYSYGSGNLTVRDSTVSGNTAGHVAGGLWLAGDGAQTLTNVTVSGNTAGSYGGGLLVDGLGVLLQNSTIFGNSAPDGANLHNRVANSFVRNTIVGAPVGSGNCGSGSGAGPFFSGGNNVISDETCGVNPDDKTATDPQLGPLADNGGPTRTHLPNSGSPALDFGQSTGCPATDQRGYARPAGNACDVGAVEVGAATALADESLRCGGEFPADADTMLVESDPTFTHGDITVLSISRSGGVETRALLRFSPAGLPPGAAISSAEIELPLYDFPGFNPTPNPVLLSTREVTEPWVENAATWGNQPANDSAYPDVSYAAAGNILRIDVTALAARWANGELAPLGVVIAPGGTGDMNVQFNTREEGSGPGPRLVVRCTPRYDGNPADRAAKDAAQQAALQKLTQNSAAAPSVTFGQQGGVLHATFRVAVPADAGKPSAGVDESEARARWFLTEYKGLLRLNDPAAELELERRDDTNSHLRFRQLVDGVPVEGGELVVHLAGATVIGLDGYYLPDAAPLGAPALDAATATGLALAAAGPGAVAQGEPQLRYVAEAMFNPAGDPRLRLAWKVAAARGDGVYHYLVDADSGKIVAGLPQSTTVFDLALSRVANTAATTACSTGSMVTGGTLWYTEAGRVAGQGADADADTGFAASRKTYNYLLNTRGIGRDGINGSGGQITVFTNVGTNWQNAQFFCGQAEFGAGMVTQDIVAHEFAHGLMNSTVFPTYQRESGALNESLADVFGYATDSDDWTLGEGSTAGTLRNMEFPAQFSHPDRYGGFVSFPATTTCAGNTNDNCNVHSNSGIHNKAAQLLMAGGTHGGYSVSPMGRDKAVALYYNILRFNLITTNATFLDVRNALINLIQFAISPPPFITIDLGWSYTAADLCRVRNAYAAVGVGAGDANCDGTEDPAQNQWFADQDGDGIRNDLDRCPTLKNSDNNDSDGDGAGDPCDPDDDNDRICDYNGPLNAGQPGLANACARGGGTAAGNVFDNCRLVANTAQTDSDNDNFGDACDDDRDGDGRPNARDNCPDTKQGLAKGDWNDYDGDGRGDVCDWDADNDGVCDVGGPRAFGSPGVPEGGCVAGSGLTTGGLAADNCPLKENPGQEDTTETSLDFPRDRVGDACDLCPAVSDPNNADTDDDGVGDPCDRDDDNDHICDLNGPFPPGADGVVADPNFPNLGCEPGPVRKAAPLVPGDNCVQIANRDQRDDDNNGVGFACDLAERRAFFSRIGDLVARYQFKPKYGPLRYPVPICPQCVGSLPFGYEAVINVAVPQGYRVQVVDTVGSVVAKPVLAANIATLRFLPAVNAARQIGVGVESAAADSPQAALETAGDVGYYLEFVPDASLPPDSTVTAEVTVKEEIPNTGKALFLPFVRR